MANFHPESRLLSDYSAGSLAHAQAISVAAHLAFCDKCRDHLQRLNTLGGSLFELQPEADIEPRAFDRLMQEIDAEPEQVPQRNDKRLAQSETERGSQTGLPAVVNKLISHDLGSLDWKALGSHLKIARLITGDTRCEAALYNIKAGGKIPEHKHRGSEITLVLSGSFSDNEGYYGQGDFIVRTDGEKHRPMATQNEDCLCLSILEAPVVFTGFFTRLMNPFLKIHAR